MKATKIALRRDVIVAMLLLCFGVALSIAAYAVMLDGLKHSRSVISHIPIGTHRYQIWNGQACVGNFNHTLELTDDGIESKGEGTILVRLWGNPEKFVLFERSNFNALGQLGGSIFRIRFGTEEFRIGTENINPIKLLAYTRTLDNEWKDYQLRIPGPVMIYANNKQSYRIEYLHFGSMMGQYSAFLQHPSLQSMQLRIEESTDESAAACSDTSQALDLAPIFSAFVPAMTR